MSAKVGAKDPSTDEEFLSQLYKGGELLAAGKVVEAKDHLERAFKLHPRNEKAQNLLGLTYFKLGLFDRASEIYELLVRENPADPTLRVNLGLVYLKTNNLPRAIKEFETSTDLDPEHKKAHNYLGLALAQSGDYARAREHFIVAGSDAMAEKMARALTSPASAAPAAAAAPHTAAPASALAAEPPAAAAPPGPPPSAPLPIEVMEVEEASVIVSAEIAERSEQSQVQIEVMTDEEVPADSEVISADDLIIKARPSAPDATTGPGAAELVARAQSLGGADKPPLPAPGFEGMPVPAAPAPTVVLSNDWGAQFASDAAPSAEPGGDAAAEDDMRMADDEGPPSIPMADSPDSQAQPTSEAAVATGVQVPVESLPQGEATWDSMPVVEAEEVLLEVVPRPSQPPADSGMTVTVGWNPEQIAPVAEAAADEVGVVDMFPSGEGPVEGGSPPPQAGAAEDSGWSEPAAAAPLSAEDPAWLTGPAPAGQSLDAQQVGDADQSAYPEQPNDAAQMGYAEQTAYGEQSSEGAQSAYDEQSADAEQASDRAQSGYLEQSSDVSQADYPEQSAYAEQSSDVDGADAAFADPSAGDGGYAEPPPADAYGQQSAGDGGWAEPPAQDGWGEQPVDPANGEAAGGQAPYEAGAEGYAQPAPPAASFAAMNAPRLEELGPSLDWSQGERLPGPFNLNSEGLALSIDGEVLARLPGLLAVAGTVDATPEFKRSRGRATEQTFGEGPMQLQRVKGQGVVYLDPGQASYQAIDLADEGAYIREERVFAFEESVGFENARLNGPGGISVDVVHLKGQGKVLLKLEGPLKAMAIPSGTPLKVPLARLVGWYGQISVRVMGFVGQGAVELTGDGYALLAA